MELKVLIVEDNFIIQMFIESTINAMGHEVIGAMDMGDDALDFLERNEPNIILLDIGLAGKINGIELAEKINELYQIPFVFLTGNSDRPTLAKARDTNPLHIISKPIDEDKLRNEMGLIIEKMSAPQSI